VATKRVAKVRTTAKPRPNAFCPAGRSEKRNQPSIPVDRNEADAARKALEERRVRFGANEFVNAAGRRGGDGGAHARELVGLFLKAGMAVDERNALGMTALMAAASEGRADLVALLLEHGADPDAADTYGQSALTQAASRGRAETVRLLLEACADPNQAERDQTALLLAARAGAVETAEMLLRAGADPLVTDRSGGTTLHAAAAAGTLALVKLLVEYGADVKAEESAGSTPLHRLLGYQSPDEPVCGSCDLPLKLLPASRKEYARARKLENDRTRAPIAAFLIEEGADADAETDDDQTPLMLAAAKNYPECVRTLLAEGADSGEENSDGKTALEIARGHGSLDAVEALQ
jgi:ankyrin repeat protein